MPPLPINPPESPRQRSSNFQTKSKPDQITALHQNLKLMKNQAEQFLKKAHKELPPITKPRHYLYLNFLKQNLNLSQIINQDNNLTIQNPSNPNLINHSEVNSYAKKKNLKQNKTLIPSTNPQDSESMIVIKRNNKDLIKIVPEAQISQFNHLTGKSVQLSLPKSARQPLNSFRTFNSAQFKGNPKNRNQSSSQSQFIDENIAKLRHTQKISAQIINSLQSENISLRYSKIHSSRSVTVKQMVPVSPKNFQINEGKLEEIFIKEKSKKDKKASAKYLLAEKLMIKEKPKTILHQTLEPKIDTKRKKKVSQKIQDSILDHIFAPTKNILNQKAQQSSKQNEQQILELLSSDSIDINQDKIGITNQGMRKQASHSFNPLRSTNLLRDKDINNSLFCFGLRHSLQIPRAIENLPLNYKKKWIKQLEVSMQKLSNSRYQPYVKASDQVNKEQSKTYSLWKRASIIQKKPSEQILIRKRSLDQQKNFRLEKWQPWSSNEISQNLQSYNFQQIVEIQ